MNIPPSLYPRGSYDFEAHKAGESLRELEKRAKKRIQTVQDLRDLSELAGKVSVHFSRAADAAKEIIETLDMEKY